MSKGNHRDRAVDDGNGGCMTAANYDGQRKSWGNMGNKDIPGGQSASCLGISLSGVVPSRSTLPSSSTSQDNLPTAAPGGIALPSSSTSRDNPPTAVPAFPSTSLNNPPTALFGGISLPSSTSLNNSPSAESSDRSTSRGPIAKSFISQFTTSVRYGTDPSGTTDITSIGVLPGTNSSTTSTKSGRNAGAIAGAVIPILFILIIIGFLLQRRRVRRRNRVAPSAQYMAEYGDRPLSRGWIFFNRRRNSQDPGHQNVWWQGRRSRSGHTHDGQGLFGHAHMDVSDELPRLSQGPEMRETQGLTNTSSGAAAGHSPAPDDPH